MAVIWAQSPHVLQSLHFWTGIVLEPQRELFGEAEHKLAFKPACLGQLGRDFSQRPAKGCGGAVPIPQHTDWESGHLALFELLASSWSPKSLKRGDSEKLMT